MKKLFLLVRHGEARESIAPLYLEEDYVIGRLGLQSLAYGEELRGKRLKRFLSKGKIGSVFHLFKGDWDNSVDAVVVRVDPGALGPSRLGNEDDSLHCIQTSCKRQNRIDRIDGTVLQWKRPGDGLMLVHNECAWYPHKAPIDELLEWSRFSAVTRANGFADFEAAELFRGLMHVAKNEPKRD